MILKYDCRYFEGDRPCEPHKREGVKCDTCPYYEVIKSKILIVKLDAIGDVLRTTAILHGLKEDYPGSEITWVTRSSAMPIFKNNTLVNQVLEYESAGTMYFLYVQQFDVVINLDAAQPSAALASLAKGTRKLGFGMDARGKVYPFNEEAISWFEMGAFDDIKKKNTHTYQDIMLDICKISQSNKEIVLSLSPDEIQFAEQFSQSYQLKKTNRTIGMNTGASPRWQFKQWTLEGYTGLIKKILKETDWTILLYGGPYERERNATLAAIDKKRVIDTGSDNSLRQFFSLITLSDVFITGDTLAMHAATALKKNVIALFGPTSEAEIETYGGRIIKIHADLDCLCCYKMRCDFDPNCMNSITPDRIFFAVKSALQTIKILH
ncbi:MAG: glycosyltransferase family 9 protein [Bacteroidota bacterium]